MEVVQETFGVRITKRPPVVTPTAAHNTNKKMTMTTRQQFNPRDEIYSALDLPEEDNEPGLPYIAFSATEVTPTAALAQIEKGTWPLDPLPNIRPGPHFWPFVERIKPTISLGE